MELKKENYPDILNQFIDKLHTDRRTDNTIRNYTFWIIEYLKFMKSIKFRCAKKEINDVDISKIPNILFKKITINDIEKFKKYLSDKGNSGGTVNRKLASIFTFHKFLVKKKIIGNNIIIDVDKEYEEHKLRRSLSLEESNNLLDVIEKDKRKLGLRNYCLFTIYLSTGMRFSELINLNINQIEDLKKVKINGKGRKQRKIIFNKACIKVLEEYLPYRKEYLSKRNIKSDLLFLSQHLKVLSNNQVGHMLKEYAKQAGIKDAQELCPHELRHTFASLTYKYGYKNIVTLSNVLGHENVSTTQIYTHIDDEEIEDVVNSNPLANR